jgi:hypothetical protein
MMSALVAGSAWICPPVDGWLLVPGTPLVPDMGCTVMLALAAVPVVPVVPVVPMAPLLMAARKVVASLVASAFFK